VEASQGGGLEPQNSSMFGYTSPEAIMPKVRFQPGETVVEVPPGTLISEAARQAGLDLALPCGGQGRCGRCLVIVQQGAVRRRSTQRLLPEQIQAGWALACQTLIEQDTLVAIPPQERIARPSAASHRQAASPGVSFPYDPQTDQPIRQYVLRLPPPSLEDQTDDWSRLQRELRRQFGLRGLTASLPVLRQLSQRLREAHWHLRAVIEWDAWDRPDGPARLLDLRPAEAPGGLWGAAVDIGTTTVTVYLVDLQTGQVAAQAADYNAQIARGEDIISRIIYASKPGGLEELQALVRETVHRLLAQCCQAVGADPGQVYKMTVAGNTTMMHLFLGVPPEGIRLTPYIPTVNHWPSVQAHQLGLAIHPEATVDCLPGVASYLGADITAGVLSSGLADTEQLTLFLDIGTNGEMVLGNREWMISCAASAGPAFEGAGVQCGMRATDGAIEELWISGQTYEPSWQVIGQGRPRGICGSGLICLLAEMLVTGLIDKAGNWNFQAPTPRLRRGPHGGEYVVAWAPETAHGEDIVITQVDIENLLRAKAAMYAGCTVLARQVGVRLEEVGQVLIGGGFGQSMDVEKAIQIGLLPDLPWDRFQFLGNTAVRGAYYGLISRRMRRRLTEIAQKITYWELSADNSFFEEFNAALFLPHTNLRLFPSVADMALKQ
jgi:uncharacterized 2Fe-2S/4Fe-4S cluster protein (DUF4445 family)